MTTPTGTHGERDRHQSATYRAALEYVRRGWKIVALHWVTGAGQCSCGRPGCKAAGKHPIEKGWASADGVRAPAEHPGRWEQRPHENIGILTGKASGFWVLDFDPDDADAAGWELHDRLTGEHGLQPHVRTGGGGYHWRFLMPADGRPIRNRQTAGGGAGRTHSLPRGWDVRGDGGQVVAPPSVSAKGEYVELIEGDDVMEPPPYETPAWLLDMATPPDRMVSIGSALAPVPSGGIAAGAVSVTSEGSSHPAVRVQAYCTAALYGVCADLAALTDGRRGTPADHLTRRLVEIANTAGWAHEAVYPHFEAASLRNSINAGGGGYAPHELPSQWARAIERVDGAMIHIPDAIEVLDAAVVAPFLPPGPSSDGELSPLSIVEPGQSISTNGETTETGGTPAPEVPPVMDPVIQRVHKRAMEIWTNQQATALVRQWEGADRPSLASRVLTGETLDSVPDPVPLIEGWLFMDSTARINGRPGQGKSFVAADLLCSVATGAPWAGLPVQQGPVLAVVAEGVSGFKLRIRAWESDRGRAVGAALHLVPFPVQTLEDREWQELTDYAVTLRPALITLDTQARMSVGARENDASDMGMVLAAVERLRAATGACVLLVHHATKTGEGDAGRGSNAMEGGVTSEFAVSKSGHVVTVRTTRQKDIESDAKVTFTLRPVDKSAVLTQALEIVEPIGPRWKERAIALYEILRTGRVDGMTYATMEKEASQHGAFNVSRKNLAVTRAWNNLLARGLVMQRPGTQRFSVHVREKHGPDGVLTPNVGEWAVTDPSGWQTYAADLINSKANFAVDLGADARADGSDKVG